MAHRTRSGWRRAFGMFLVVLCGCSTSGDPDGATPLTTGGAGSTVATVPAATPAATIVASSSVVPTSSAPPVLGGPSISDVSDADRMSITAAFETFFGGSTSTLDQKVAVLEDGETYRGMLSDASDNAQFQQMSIAFRSIVAGSDTACTSLGAEPGCAIVTHDLLIGGMPMAAGIDSAAIRASGGGWLVAASAWCNVVAIGGDSCEAALDGGTP